MDSTDIAQLFSGHPPYSWLVHAMHVIAARVGGIEPFPARRITGVEEGHKEYSLRCLSKNFEDQPGACGIVDLLGAR
jgi:hypothetical protein